MHKASHLEDARAIVTLQRLRRTQADARAAEALAAAEAAKDAAWAAATHANDASADWQDHVGGVAHDPAYGRWLAERLIDRTGDAERAQTMVKVTSEMSARRDQERRAADGTVRAGERRLKSLSAQAARRREGRQLDEMADRITYRWLKQ